jgi:putative DNA primase/helicase
MYIEEIAGALQGKKIRDGEYMCLCPCHNDHTPSLSLSQKNGNILVHCLAGCSQDNVLQALRDRNLWPEKKQQPNGPIVREYNYCDECGDLSFQVVRIEPKNFRQRRPGGRGGWIWNLEGVRRVLYRLPDLLEASQVFIPEGEKDADRLVSEGLTATCNPGGAGNWLPEYSESLRGKNCILLPDNDGPGRQHALKVAESLRGRAKSIKIVELPGLLEKGDVSDWIDAGGTREDLLKLIENAPEWNPNDKISDAVNAFDWEDPVLLEAFRLPEMKPIPGIIGKFSQAVATATETPIELSQGLVLAAVASACQGRYMVQVKSGYSEPVNVWIVVALDSGNRKSSVLIEVTRPLISWESQKRFEMEEEIRRATSRRASQEVRLKSLRSKYGKAKISDLEKIEKEIQDLELEFVEVPVSPRVWCDDVTTEHLGTLMAAHKGRMSVLSAEGGIIDTISGRYSNGILNMDLYLKGHSGDPVRVDRGSREPIYMRDPSLTMGLSPQPDVLKNMANIPGFRGRGFIARIGYLLPGSKLGFRSLETKPVPEQIRDEYERVIHYLLDIEPCKNDRGESVPYILNLSKEAYQEWMNFSKVVEVNLCEGGKFEYITDWAGKLPGFAIRLSGLLHCIEDPHQPWTREISLDTMSQALETASIFSHHALAVFDLMGADKALQGSRRIWRWVERGRFKQFSKRDCYNSLKGSFPRVQNIEPCLDVLEERGYIAAVKQQTGGRPTILYNVNPKLTGGWS